ncbi:MAG: chromate resistance protein ChrB domain-containing protein [Betaproteobacteria bacterium]
MQETPGSAPVGAGEEWLQFLVSLQGPQQAARMRIWRAMRTLGAAVLRDGVYLLPSRPDLLDQLRRLALDAERSSGVAQILAVRAWDESQALGFRLLFDRTAEYEVVMHALAAMQATAPEPADAALALTRLRRDFDAIVVRDFFPGEAMRQVHEAIARLAAALEGAANVGEPHARSGRIPRVNPAGYRGRVWATRRRPWADRLGSAWLIRRFIDPDARFVWLEDCGDRTKQMVGFDFDGARFTHVAAMVTFEVLMHSFGLEGDAGLRHVGDVVHHLDVGGIAPPTAAGFDALLRAARVRFPDDEELFAEAAKLFELLYLSAA